MDLNEITTDELIAWCQYVFKNSKDEQEILDAVAELNLRQAALAEFVRGPEYRTKILFRTWRDNFLSKLKVIRKNKTIASLKAQRSRRRTKEFEDVMTHKLVNVLLKERRLDKIADAKDKIAEATLKHFENAPALTEDQQETMDHLAEATKIADATGQKLVDVLKEMKAEKNRIKARDFVESLSSLSHRENVSFDDLENESLQTESEPIHLNGEIKDGTNG